MNLNLEILAKTEELFLQKNWEIENDELKIYSLYNKYCARLSLFSIEEQNLIIDLTKEFINIPQNDYEQLFFDSLNGIENIETYKSIYISVLKPLSEKGPKSSDYLWYYLKNYSNYLEHNLGKKPSFITNISEISPFIIDKSILILIDDFIGSGETVEITLNELFDQGMLDPNAKFKVLSLYGQEQGLLHLQRNFGDKVACDKILRRGIADIYVDEDLTNNIASMEKIEEKIGVKAEYRFGYKCSESLIAFQSKSPNNTFPVFWLPKKRNLGPFKR